MSLFVYAIMLQLIRTQRHTHCLCLCDICYKDTMFVCTFVYLLKHVCVCACLCVVYVCIFIEECLGSLCACFRIICSMIVSVCGQSL